MENLKKVENGPESFIQGIELANEIVKWHCREYTNSELFHSFFGENFLINKKFYVVCIYL